MKMRRSRQRKGKLGSKQVGTWNVAKASSGPSYEAFTIPNPRGYLSKGASESKMETSLTGRKRPASNAEHVLAPTSFGTPQHVVVGQCYSDFSHDSQRSLDGDMCSARRGVKHTMVRLSGLIPSLSPATTSGVPLSVNCDVRTKILGTESEPNQQMFRAMQSNTMSETQKHDRAGAAVCRDETGGSIANLLLLDKSCCALDSSNAQARSGFVQTDSIPRPTNPNWLYPAVFPMNYRPVNGCHGCGATRFTPPCTFQKDFPRVVHYYAEHATLSQMSLQPSRVEPSACCERVDFEGTTSQSIYAPTMEQDEGHICGARYINRDGVLMCPAPWVYEGRIFPGNPAMGVNWVSDCINEGQPRQSSSAKLEESYCHEMPDPVYPSAHCKTCSTDYSPDLDVDTQRHLEEKIAHEILLLSQKLANLQAQCGARRPVHNNTKPAVLNRPQAPPLDVNMRRTQRDPKSANSRTSSISLSIRCQGKAQPRSGASSSSRTTRRQAAESRFKLEDRKLEGGRIKGANSSIPAQSSSRGSDSGASSSTATFNVDKNQLHSRGGSGGHSSENCSTGSRGSAMHCGVHQHGANEAVDSVQGCEQNFREDGEDGKASNKARSFSRPYKRCVRGRGASGLHLEECSYSDDMKENLRTGGMNVQGHPNGSKQFDWEKFRFEGAAGLRGNEECVEAIDSLVLRKSNSQEGFTEVHAETWLPNAGTSKSVSKSAQPGEGNSPAEGAWTSTDGNDKQECENRGKRLQDSSIENNHAKSGKRDADSPKELCGLDSRIAHHLLKAGLRRKPHFWKTPGLGPVPCMLRLKKKTFGTRSPRKDCGKRLRRRTLFDLNLNSKTNLKGAGAALEEGDDKNSDSGSQPWQLMEEETGGSEETVDAQCQREVAGYKAEYETFVENTALRLHKNLDNEDYSSIVNLQALTSAARSVEDELKLSEAPLVCLSKPSSQPAKKTFIRCIEVVTAMKKKNQLCKLNGRKAFGDRYSYRRMDCLVESKDDDGMEKELHSRADANGVVAGGASHNAEEQVIREPVEPPETCCWDKFNRRDVESSGFQNLPSATTLAEAREMKLFEESLLQSVAQEEAHSLAFKEHSENTYNLAFMTNVDCDEGIPPPSNPEASIVDQVSSLAAVLSRVMPKQMDSMDAEQLRARWEELIDALEKERLGLPKIKTGGRKIGVSTWTNSPRDSGCVKRIAEQMKSLRATTLNLGKGVSITQKEKDGLEDVGITKERTHWNKVEQKQAVVF